MLAGHGIPVGLMVLSCLGCGEPDPSWVSPVAFDTAVAWIRSGADSTGLLVEVARTADQRSFGLMLRPRLDAGLGMIFVYDEPQADRAGFWMWRTRMPLDIAFADSTGVIVRILEMEPCASIYRQGCPIYQSGEGYWSALEVNRGWFAERGIGIGAVLKLDTLARS